MGRTKREWHFRRGDDQYMRQLILSLENHESYYINKNNLLQLVFYTYQTWPAVGQNCFNEEALSFSLIHAEYI